MSETQPKPPPTVGRIVHYRVDDACCAALVTRTDSETEISLAVVTPTGIGFAHEVTQREDQILGNTWHWPCVITSGGER